MGFVEGGVLIRIASIEGGFGEGVQVGFDGAGAVDAPGVVDNALGEIQFDGVGRGEIGIKARAVGVVSCVLLRSTEDGVAREAVFDGVESRVEFPGFGDRAGGLRRVGAVGCLLFG